jgi:hypothetical protein
MRCMSILQPWSGTILSGTKLVENRSWHRFFPEPFDCLIHAGKRYDTEAEDFIRDVCLGLGVSPPDFDRCRRERGAILGVARFVECTRPMLVPIRQLPWAFGPWCFVLERPRIFAEPIPYRGELGFFDVPDEAVGPALNIVA